MNEMVLKLQAEDRLRDEVSQFYVQKKRISKVIPDYIYSYLCRETVTSVYDIGFDLIRRFYMFVANDINIPAACRAFYTSGLFGIIINAYHDEYSDILKKTENRKPFVGSDIFKVYLIFKGYHSMAEFDYEDREALEDICSSFLVKKSISEMLAVVDSIKIESIKNNAAQNPLRKPKLVFENKKINLMYHPDPAVALSLGRKIRKENYLFDFSKEGSPVMKKQIFDLMEYYMYNDPSGTVSDRGIRLDRHITPLRMLLDFCYTEKISDISRFTVEQTGRFTKFICENNKSDENRLFLNDAFKVLFKDGTENSRINWDANIWYPGFMKISPDRIDASNPVGSLRFDVIKDDICRQMCKVYIKYRVGLTDASLNMIRGELYQLHNFFGYCTESGVGFDDIDSGVIDDYFSDYSADLSDESYNRRLGAVCRMFEYLKSKGYVKSNPADWDYYKRQVYFPHHNRIVTDDVIVRSLDIVGEIPPVERLMFINLLCVGMRIGELCEIKGGAYFERSGETWLKLYQEKMRSEKVVPVPAVLFAMMQAYIKDNNIAADEYVFKNKDGGAYKSGTFRKKMKKIFEKHGIETRGYFFRAHDYRHTIASALYNDGTSVNAIRDYLGHRTSEMTKQYIDYVTEKVSAANEKYFSKGEKLITSAMYDRYSLKLYLRDMPGYRPEMDSLNCGNQCFDLGKLPAGPVRSELRNYICSSLSALTPASQRKYISYYDRVAEFLRENNIRSFHGLDREKLLIQMKGYLMKKGYALIHRQVRDDQVSIFQNDSLLFLERVYDYVTADDISEYEKDVWNLDRLDIKVRNDESNPTCSVNFGSISQKNMKDEMKRIALVEFGYKTVRSVVRDIAGMGYFSSFLKAEHPGVQSLCDLNREIIEDYIIYLTTESDRGSSANKDLVLIKNILALAARMFEAEELKKLVLYTDYRKNVKPVYRSYSDREIAEVNRLYRQIDEQAGRVFILQQLLGCRISEALKLKQDCISEEKGIFLINIYQTKVSRSYRKPVNKEIVALIEASIEYTNTLYGPCEYVFVRDRHPDQPMQYAYIAGQLRHAIFCNDARMDNGERFGVGTHLMRHAYGKRLTEMHLDDEIIAKLLGHNGTRSVGNYRRMGDMALAEETKDVREMLNNLLTRYVTGGNEDE